jgi:hypothetical protein
MVSFPLRFSYILYACLIISSSACVPRCQPPWFDETKICGKAHWLGRLSFSCYSLSPCALYSGTSWCIVISYHVSLMQYRFESSLPGPNRSNQLMELLISVRFLLTVGCLQDTPLYVSTSCHTVDRKLVVACSLRSSRAKFPHSLQSAQGVRADQLIRPWQVKRPCLALPCLHNDNRWH